MEKLEILLFQKDYEEALQKIDSFKKNNVTFETDDSDEAELQSGNNSINQAFFESESRVKKNSEVL